MMVWRLQGGLNDGMGSREVDDSVGSREIFMGNFGSLTVLVKASRD
jgi:hypothetical protein